MCIYIKSVVLESSGSGKTLPRIALAIGNQQQLWSEEMGLYKKNQEVTKIVRMQKGCCKFVSGTRYYNEIKKHSELSGVLFYAIF
jgi:hypothetical protein